MKSAGGDVAVMSHWRLGIAIGKAELSFYTRQSAVDPAGMVSRNVSPELCKSTLKKGGGFLFPFLRFAHSSIIVSFPCRAQCLASYCFQTILCLTPSTGLQKARKAPERELSASGLSCGFRDCVLLAALCGQKF